MTALVGPDPAALGDDELVAAAALLADLALRVAGHPVTTECIDQLDAPEQFAYRFLHLGFKLLVAEDRRRTALEVDAGMVEIERFLQGL